MQRGEHRQQRTMRMRACVQWPPLLQPQREATHVTRCKQRSLAPRHGHTVRSDWAAVRRLEPDTGAQKGCSGPYTPSGSLASRSAGLGLCASLSLPARVDHPSTGKPGIYNACTASGS